MVLSMTVFFAMGDLAGGQARDAAGPTVQAQPAWTASADDEGCAEGEEMRRYLQPGLLQRGAGLSPPAVAPSPLAAGAVAAEPGDAIRGEAPVPSPQTTGAGLSPPAVAPSPPAAGAVAAEPGGTIRGKVPLPSPQPTGVGLSPLAVAPSPPAAGAVAAEPGDAIRGKAPVPSPQPMMIGLGLWLGSGRTSYSLALGVGSTSAGALLAGTLVLLLVCALCCCLAQRRSPGASPPLWSERSGDPAAGKLLGQQAGKAQRTSEPPGRPPSGDPFGREVPLRSSDEQSEASQRPLPASAASLPGALPTARESYFRGGAGPHSTPASGAPGAGAMPVLCQALLLPSMESRFCVSVEALQRGFRRGSLDIMGTSGKKLLDVVVQDPGGRRQLQICSVGSREPRVTVEVDTVSSMKIYGERKTFFATLDTGSSPNECVIVYDGEAKARLLAEPGPEMHFRVVTAGGQHLAAAGRSGTLWMLQVKPNTDAILIASCVLSMIVFGSGVVRSNRPSVEPSPMGRQSTAGSRSSLSQASRPPSHVATPQPDNVPGSHTFFELPSGHAAREARLPRLPLPGS